MKRRITDGAARGEVTRWHECARDWLAGHEPDSVARFDFAAVKITWA